jgi:hypothetical protein
MLPQSPLWSRGRKATALVASLADFYEIESLGRMQLREDRLGELANAKDFGVRCADYFTWWSTTTTSRSS